MLLGLSRSGDIRRLSFLQWLKCGHVNYYGSMDSVGPKAKRNKNCVDRKPAAVRANMGARHQASDSQGSKPSRRSWL